MKYLTNVRISGFGNIRKTFGGHILARSLNMYPTSICHYANALLSYLKGFEIDSTGVVSCEQYKYGELLTFLNICKNC